MKCFQNLETMPRTTSLKMGIDLKIGRELRTLILKKDRKRPVKLAFFHKYLSPVEREQKKTDSHTELLVEFASSPGA